MRIKCKKLKTKFLYYFYKIFFAGRKIFSNFAANWVYYTRFPRFPMARKSTSIRISTLGSRFSSTISVCLVLFLSGIVCMTAMLGNTVSKEIRRNVGFIVKLERDIESTTIADIGAALRKNPAIATVEFSSADSILAQERRIMGDVIPSNLDANPYSPEFSATMQPGATAADSVAAVIAAFEGMAGIDEIISENTVIEGLDKALSRIGTIAAIGAGIIFLIAIALINNTVSLSIYSRRHTIRTMQLVGATRGFIRRPFVMAAIGIGIVGALIATAGLCGVRIYACSFDSIVEAAMPWWEMALLGVFLACAGVILCSCTAAFATNRYLNLTSDEFFVK